MTRDELLTSLNDMLKQVDDICNNIAKNTVTFNSKEDFNSYYELYTI